MLKGSAVGDDEYNNSKILYTLLKMRDLPGLNDLYIAQDVILLCEIMENRFDIIDLCMMKRCTILENVI